MVENSITKLIAEDQEGLVIHRVEDVSLSSRFTHENKAAKITKDRFTSAGVIFPPEKDK